MRRDTQQRDEEIRNSAESAHILAERFSLSPSRVYRIRRNGAVENFQAGNGRSQVGGRLFSELGMTGLRRSGGIVDDEEYDRVWKPLSKKLALIREMSDDPIVAAVLQAIRMTLRKIAWKVEPGGESRADKQAAEFLESCKEDMSQSWSDSIDQALNMVRDGFAVAEVVYKKRAGLRREASSQYDDGRISWRKWLFIGPDSLAPGSPWIFDDAGGIQGVNQQPPPNYQTREIPIEKLLLFRTTIYKNNPEGKPLLRPMYPAWYMKKNLEEIEAISAERIGAGFPVVYAGSDVSKNLDDPDSDGAKLVEAATNIRVDEQMSLFVPYAKMGGGAREGEGVLFEFISPPGTKAINFHETITRYEQRMTMVGLAQFIHLGMNQVGARALGETSQDFFTTGLTGWLDSIEDVIHRFGTERLFRLNHFPGLTGIPRIKHENVGKYTLKELADYIAALAGPGLITPENELEQFLRRFADLPEKPVDMVELEKKIQTIKDERRLEAAKNPPAPPPSPAQTPVKPPTPETGDSPQAGTSEKTDTTPVEGEQPKEEASERFADLRGGGPGRRSKSVEAVNAYQRELERAYRTWADDMASELAEAEPDERDDLMAAALAALLASLRDEGRRRIAEAMRLAMGDDAPTAEVLQATADAIAENDRFLSDSLIPAIRAKLEAGLLDEDILTAIQSGDGDDAIGGLLATLSGRAASYAGTWWMLYNQVIGRKTQESGREVIWYLDPRAKHCEDCPRWGSPEGTVYESYEKMLEITGGMAPADGVACGNYCRCGLGEGDFRDVSGIE